MADVISEKEDRAYSDGHPLDKIQYLECKLILKPDRFTSARTFFDYGELVGETARKFGISLDKKGVVFLGYGEVGTIDLAGKKAFSLPKDAQGGKMVALGPWPDGLRVDFHIDFRMESSAYSAESHHNNSERCRSAYPPASARSLTRPLNSS